MPVLADFDIEQLADELARRGHKPMHAKKILRAFYQANGRPDFSKLDGSDRLKADLARDFTGTRSTVLSRRTSGDGTSKLLVGFPTGGAAEAVLMPAYRPDIAAGCVSSQIGCAMGCDFCASTKGGLERNLEAGEIVEQFIHLKEASESIGRKLNTIVFMGMGEPMHNLDNVIDAVKRIADPDMGGVGWRQVTVSTVGIVPGIDRLAAADLNVHLALSLHAPDDATRSELVPSNRRYAVADIVAAAKRFQERTGRIVTIEYCALEGVNDSDEQARLLAQLLEGFRAHVNIIPYNSIGAGVSGKLYRRPTAERIGNFLSILRRSGIVAHVRDTRGDDVWAACGQLRASKALPIA
jgi:23S rRNA (adenine2503-C2)-methyltransferase